MTILMLAPADGPPCPRCGCRDVHVLQMPPEGVTTWWAQGRARCRHCGTPFTFREMPEIAPVASDAALEEMEFEAADIAPPEIEQPRDMAYPVRGCPQCGSPDVRVVSSGKKPTNGMPRIRYHCCLACQVSFKSVDARHLAK